MLQLTIIYVQTYFSLNDILQNATLYIVQNNFDSYSPWGGRNTYKIKKMSLATYFSAAVLILH